jgi:formamidopyrimidine-DNA glycosylase
MPELPEVETMRRGILGVVGARIQDVERAPCARRPILITPRIDHFRRRVVGQRIRDVGRVGKRVIVHLESHDAIVLEPRMTGLVLVADPPTKEHLRFRCTLAGGKVREFLYWDRRGLGSVRLFSPAEFEKTFLSGKIGPDALAMTAELFRKRLGASKRSVKVALLDQHAVAGIGNLYASEILHLCGIHPARRCDKITRAQWQTISDATQTILEAAIHYEGSTLSDGTYRNAINGEGSYQNHHQVYDRAGESCSRCGPGSGVKRIVQAQRATFFCPSCQKR